jgi:low affinity Fe/Cu permease
MHDLFSRFARSASTIVAHPIAFVVALLTVIVWAATGPALHYSENWQLIINTGTTILTFLMVFLLQNMQNRDSRAMQVKLDELLRAVKGARTELVDLENVTEEELARYCDEFKNLHFRYAKILAERGSKIEVTAENADIEVNSKSSGNAAAEVTLNLNRIIQRANESLRDRCQLVGSTGWFLDRAHSRESSYDPSVNRPHAADQGGMKKFPCLPTTGQN